MLGGGSRNLLTQLGTLTSTFQLMSKDLILFTISEKNVLDILFLMPMFKSFIKLTEH